MGGGAGGWERTVYIFFGGGLERILILFFMRGTYEEVQSN